MDDRTLFDPLPLSHSHDPQTSVDAAERHVASGKAAAHAEMALSLVRESPGMTAVELWNVAPSRVKMELGEMQEVRRRLVDLARRGLVQQGEARVCDVRGTRMVVWYASGGA